MRVLLFGGRDTLTEFLRSSLTGVPGISVCNTVAPGDEPPSASLTNLQPDAVVYLAGSRGPAHGGGPDLADAESVFSACAEHSIAHVVAVGSSEVHAPSHHHTGMVEEHRLAPRRPGNPLRDGWLDFEALAERTLGSRPATTLAVLRPAPVPARDSRDPLARLLRRRFVATLPGYEPTLQFLAAEDLAAAVGRVVAAKAAGTFHVMPASNVPLGKALRYAGARRIPVPGFLQRLFRLGRKPPQLPYLRHPWHASGAHLEQELGFRPAKTSAEAIVSAAGSGRREPRSAFAPRAFDPFGLDPDYIERFRRTLFRFLHDAYWRIEIEGEEHLPRQGPGVLVGVHRGFMPWDGVMCLHGIARATGRYPRFLIHPTLVKFPFLASYMTKLGGILANQRNGGWVLDNGELLGVFPDGIRGAFTMYRDAYTLRRSFRDDYVEMALRHRAPIIPFATVGSAEIFPIVGKIEWPAFQRFTEWPFFPVTLSLPAIPLPSKWRTRYLPPIHVERDYPPEAADDKAVVAEIHARVKALLGEALDELRARRRSIFFG